MPYNILSLTQVGYENTPTTYEDYEAQVTKAYNLNNGSNWALADLYNLGESKFRDTYTQAWDERKKRKDTIRNYAKAARVFNQRERARFPDVGITIFVECAKYEDKNRALDALSMVQAKEWTRADIRKDLKGVQDEPLKASGTIQLSELMTVLAEYGFTDGSKVVKFNVTEWVENVEQAA